MNILQSLWSGPLDLLHEHDELFNVLVNKIDFTDFQTALDDVSITQIALLKQALFYMFDFLPGNQEIYNFDDSDQAIVVFMVHKIIAEMQKDENQRKETLDLLSRLSPFHVQGPILKCTPSNNSLKKTHQIAF